MKIKMMMEKKILILRRKCQNLEDHIIVTRVEKNLKEKLLKNNEQ